MNLSIDLHPVEDKNPALTRHAIIKRPQASWSQSVFSVPLGNKIIPNRDYPYEGLSVLINGENYHFLDGIAVGVKKDGEYVALSAKNVNVSPWKMSYSYGNEAEHVSLTASYYLMNIGTKQNGCTACFLLESNALSPYRACGVVGQSPTAVVIEPIVDIRHMYDYSEPEGHFSSALNDGMLIRRDEKCISIRTISPYWACGKAPPGLAGARAEPVMGRSPTNECEVRTWRKKIEWWYKLGSGFREKADGDVVFKGEIKMPVSLGEMEIAFDDTSTALLIISCSNSEAQLEWLNERGKNWLSDEAEDEKSAKELVKSLGVKDAAIAFRALALSRFGMYVADKFFYEAGDFWFRTPWFRDQFEGIINNIETLIRMGHAERIRNIILHSFEYQDNHGRIPNRFPERAHEKLDYNNADATLLAFIAAGEFLKRNWDDDFANMVLERAELTISRFKLNDVNVVNGAPVLHENGLVSVVPWHSWTDSSRVVEIGGKKMNVSVRIPDSWCDARDKDELNKPKYFLPEINAEWIKMLSHCVKISTKTNSKKETLLTLLERAKANFKTVFWDDQENILYNVVTLDGEKDKTPGSPAVVAFSLLADENVFSQSELIKFIKGMKENLLVEKNGLPFGLLVKKSSKRIYYGDGEYHEAVVWPRDTPYLIRLLRYAGAIEEETVEGLLRSNLNHQMNESFVFYNSELFSPDNGALVPVKNPVQFWSQWVDPYIIYL
jgi:glycogen debranching enzyme